MELFFMMTAMLALIVPIAVGRARCIVITPRLLYLFKSILSTISETGSVTLEAGPKRSAAAPTEVICSDESATLSNFVRLTDALPYDDTVSAPWGQCRHPDTYSAV